mgnify:CR=1 FL=1
MAHNHQIFETQVQVLQHLHVAHMAKTGKLMSYAAFLREKCRGVATRGTKERHEMRDSAESGARQDDAASAEQEQATKPKIRALRSPPPDRPKVAARKIEGGPPPRTGLTPNGALIKMGMKRGLTAVYQALLSRDRGQGCFASNDTLAEDCGASVRTVQRHVQALERGGWITVKTQFRGDEGQTTNLIYCRVYYDGQEIRDQRDQPCHGVIYPTAIDALLNPKG